MATTGTDLLVERTRSRVKQQDLAARMGRSRVTLSKYERLAVVPDQVAAEYRAALATFDDVAGEPEAVAS